MQNEVDMLRKQVTRQDALLAALGASLDIFKAELEAEKARTEKAERERDEARQFASDLPKKKGCWVHSEPDSWCPQCAVVGAVAIRAEAAETQNAALREALGALEDCCAPFEACCDECRASMKRAAAPQGESMSPLERAAIAMWKQRRPLSFSEAEHLANPTINTTSEAEQKFARAVAKFLKATKARP